MVTSMLVNFLLMCVTLISLPRANPALAEQVAVLRSRPLQLLLAWLGVGLLCTFLLVHLWKDLSGEVSAWYFHSTPVWLLVMALGSAIFLFKMRALRRSGTDLKALFSTLPGDATP